MKSLQLAVTLEFAAPKLEAGPIWSHFVMLMLIKETTERGLLVALLNSPPFPFLNGHKGRFLSTVDEFGVRFF